MPVNVGQLQQLMEEVEREDPIDFADLPFHDHDLRSLIANQVCEMAARLEDFSADDQRLTLMAVAANLVLENFVLHARLLRGQSETDGDVVLTLLQKWKQGQ